MHYPDKSSIAHSTAYKLLFSSASVLHKSTCFWDQVILEALKIQQDVNTLNCNIGL